MMKKVDVLVGLQFGSEGKGLIAGYLGNSGLYDTVVNCNMPNAGHTYKLESNLAPDPVNEDDHQFELTASGAGDGLAIFTPTEDDMDPDDDIVFYTLRETVATKTFTSVRGQIDFDPSVVDAGV